MNIFNSNKNSTIDGGDEDDFYKRMVDKMNNGGNSDPVPVVSANCTE